MQLDVNPFNKDNLESQVVDESFDGQVGEDIFEEEKNLSRLTSKESSFQSQRS